MARLAPQENPMRYILARGCDARRWSTTACMSSMLTCLGKILGRGGDEGVPCRRGAATGGVEPRSLRQRNTHP